MTTSNYAIIGGLFLASDFMETDNVQAIAEKFNIPSTDLPDGTVFYYVGKYRMPVGDITLVTLTVTDVDGTNYYTWYFQFGSMKNVGCNPIVRITNW